jgi:hypothetical protein
MYFAADGVPQFAVRAVGVLFMLCCNSTSARYLLVLTCGCYANRTIHAVHSANYVVFEPQAQHHCHDDLLHVRLIAKALCVRVLQQLKPQAVQKHNALVLYKYISSTSRLIQETPSTAKTAVIKQSKQSS